MIAVKMVLVAAAAVFAWWMLATLTYEIASYTTPRQT